MFRHTTRCAKLSSTALALRTKTGGSVTTPPSTPPKVKAVDKSPASASPSSPATPTSATSGTPNAGRSSRTPGSRTTRPMFMDSPLSATTATSATASFSGSAAKHLNFGSGGGFDVEPAGISSSTDIDVALEAAAAATNPTSSSVGEASAASGSSTLNLSRNIKNIVFPGPTDMEVSALKAEIADAWQLLSASIACPTSAADYTWSRVSKLPTLRATMVGSAGHSSASVSAASALTLEDLMGASTAGDHQHAAHHHIHAASGGGPSATTTDVAASSSAMAEARRRMEMLESSLRELSIRAKQSESSPLVIKALIAHSVSCLCLGKTTEALRALQEVVDEAIATGKSKCLVLIHLLIADVLSTSAPLLATNHSNQEAAADRQKNGKKDAAAAVAAKSPGGLTMTTPEAIANANNSLHENNKKLAAAHVSIAKKLVQHDQTCGAEQFTAFPLTSQAEIPCNPAEVLLRVGLFESNVLRNFDDAARSLKEGMDLATGKTKFQEEHYTHLDLCICLSVSLGRIGVATKEFDLADYAFDSAIKQCNVRVNSNMTTMTTGSSTAGDHLAGAGDGELNDLASTTHYCSPAAKAAILSVGLTAGHDASVQADISEVEVLFEYASYHQHQRKAHREALNVYERAFHIIPNLLAKLESVGDMRYVQSLYGNLLFNAGLCYEKEPLVGFAQAVIVYAESLKIFEELGRDHETIKIRLNYARSLIKVSKVDVALEQLTKAAELAETVELKMRQIDLNAKMTHYDPMEVFGHLGHCLQYHVLHFDSAVAAFKKAIQFSNVNPTSVRPKTLCWIQEHLAKLHMRRGDFKAAIQMWSLRVTVAKQHARFPTTAKASPTSTTAADATPNAESEAKAERKVQRHDAQSKAIIPIQWFEASMNLAACYNARHEYTRQGQIYSDLIDVRKTPETTREQRFEAAQQYAVLCQSQRQYSKAASLFQVLLKIEKQNPHIMVQVAVCKLHAVGVNNLSQAQLDEIAHLYDGACSALEIRRYDDSLGQLQDRRKDLKRDGRVFSAQTTPDGVQSAVDAKIDADIARGSNESATAQLKKEKVEDENDRFANEMFQWRNWDTCYIYGEAAVFHHEKTKNFTLAKALYEKALARPLAEEAKVTKLTTYPYVAANFGILLFDALGDREGAEHWFSMAIEAGKIKEQQDLLKNPASTAAGAPSTATRGDTPAGGTAAPPFSAAAYNASSLFVGYLTAIQDFPRAIDHLKEMVKRFPSEAPFLLHKIASMYESEVTRDVLIAPKNNTSSSSSSEAGNRKGAKLGGRGSIFHEDGNLVSAQCLTPNESAALWAYVDANEEHLKTWSGGMFNLSPTLEADGFVPLTEDLLEEEKSVVLDADDDKGDENADKPKSNPEAATAAAGAGDVIDEATMEDLPEMPYKKPTNDEKKASKHEATKDGDREENVVPSVGEALDVEEQAALFAQAEEALYSPHPQQRLAVADKMTMKLEKLQSDKMKGRKPSSSGKTVPVLHKQHLIAVMWSSQRSLAMDLLKFVTGKIKDYELARDLYEKRVAVDDDPIFVTGYARLLIDHLKQPNKALEVLQKAMLQDKAGTVFDLQSKLARKAKRSVGGGRQKSAFGWAQRLGDKQEKTHPIPSPAPMLNPILVDHYSDVVSHIAPERKDVGELMHLRSYTDQKRRYEALLKIHKLENKGEAKDGETKKEELQATEGVESMKDDEAAAASTDDALADDATSKEIASAVNRLKQQEDERKKDVSRMPRGMKTVADHTLANAKSQLFQSTLFFAAFLSYSNPAYSKAVSLYKETLELFPKDVSATHCYASFLAYTYKKMVAPGKYVSPTKSSSNLPPAPEVFQEAKKYAERCIQLSPKAGTYRTSYGHFLWSTGHLPEAWEVFAEALVQCPNEIGVLRAGATFMTERLLDMVDPTNAAHIAPSDFSAFSDLKDKSASEKRRDRVVSAATGRQSMINATQDLYNRAFAISSQDVNTLSWYANFLQGVKQEKASAEAVRDTIRQIEGNHGNQPADDDNLN